MKSAIRRVSQSYVSSWRAANEPCNTATFFLGCTQVPKAKTAGLGRLVLQFPGKTHD